MMITKKKYKTVWWCGRCDTLWTAPFLAEVHHDLTSHQIYMALITEVQPYDKPIRRSDEKRKDPALR